MPASTIQIFVHDAKDADAIIEKELWATLHMTQVHCHSHSDVYSISAAFYSYDIHGNVDTLLQDYGGSSTEATANIMNRNGNRWIRMVYNYDLISGKVNNVAYNPRLACLMVFG